MKLSTANTKIGTTLEKKQPAAQEGPHMRNQNILLTHCEEELRNGSARSKSGKQTQNSDWNDVRRNWYQAQLEQSRHTAGTLSGRKSEIVHLAKFEETEEDTAAIECKVDVTNARNLSKWSKSSTLEARRRNEQMLNSDKMAFSKCPSSLTSGR